MSLQERTLVVRNFDPDKTTASLLKELCLQGGPVRKVVIRPDHAFVEYEDVESVGYSKALLDRVEMFGRVLQFEPKLKMNVHSKYTKALNDYINFDKEQRALEQQMRFYHQQQQLQTQYQPQYQAPYPATIPPHMQMDPSMMQPPIQHQAQTQCEPHPVQRTASVPIYHRYPPEIYHPPPPSYRPQHQFHQRRR